jgi:hypothetical protein
VLHCETRLLIIDFSDCRGQDYAVDLRRCVAYMFATGVAASVVGSPGNWL